ncbi:LicD family protein [Weissella cibaria]|uniref:LicD family protein n=1 Tax=Weissella cibaria TaxID=137591 RepID=UPI00189C8FA5|nr:LicD family protein [Weissella cibaria]
MVKHEMTINEVQALTREMLQDLANFVSQNNRRLLLLGGSMLGLVRHDGFIPWDDDLDVGLFREDYDWLMKHYQPTNSRFRLMTEEDENTLVPNARVVDSETIAQSDYYKINHGVFIDIFPVDQVQTGIKLKTFLLTHKVLNVLRNVARSTGNFPDDAQIVPLKRGLSKIVAYKQTHRFVELEIKASNRLVRGIQYPDAIGVLNGMYGRKEIFNGNIFAPLIMKKFEGAEVYIPQNFNQYLTQFFGDWQTPIKSENKHARFFTKE